MGEDFPLELLVTVTFEETADGKTRFTLRHAGMPEGEHGEMTRMGWNQSLIAEPGKQETAITHLFNAP